MARGTDQEALLQEREEEMRCQGRQKEHARQHYALFWIGVGAFTAMALIIIVFTGLALALSANIK